MPLKSVLITGCSPGGIGSALADQFQRQGLRVFATARDPEQLSFFQNRPNITVLPLDISSRDSIENCIEAVKRNTGGTLDFLINNSGIGYTMPVLDSDLEDSKHVFNVNFWAPLNIMRAFIPLLLPVRGTIVNLCSVTSHNPTQWTGIYAASKAALEAVGETLRLELQPYGVKVVSVVTGEVQNQFYVNQTNQLPPTSYHLQNRDDIARKAENQGQGMDTTIFAKKVVDDLLGGANGKLVRAKQNTAFRSFRSTMSAIMERI